MKKPLIAVLGTIALAVSLTACGSSTDTSATDTSEVYTPAPVVTVTEQAQPSSGFTRAEDGFLADVHGVNNSVIEGNDDKTIVETGHLVCDALDEGNTVTDITDYLIDTGDYGTDTKTEFAAAMIVGAVMNLCSEYEYQIPN